MKDTNNIEMEVNRINLKAHVFAVRYYYWTAKSKCSAAVQNNQPPLHQLGSGSKAGPNFQPIKAEEDAARERRKNRSNVSPGGNVH